MLLPLKSEDRQMPDHLQVETLENLVQLYASKGVTRLYMKVLAKNNNSKQQIYLGASFAALTMFPTLGIFSDPNDDNPIFKARLDFYWMMAGGALHLAPATQIVFYPQYPEVRLSGFLEGCANGPSDMLDRKTCQPGRLMFFGVHPDGRIIASILPHTHPIANEIRHAHGIQKIRIFYEIPVGKDPKEELLSKLKEINLKGWMNSRKLDADGNDLPCNDSHCGGYTFESEFGIRPNGEADPDFKGWELKQYGVRNFTRLDSSVITLMTPEPTSGYYKSNGVVDFVRRFGYKDRLGREDRYNFGGIHKVGVKHHRTKLTLTLVDFDGASGQILSKSAGISLLTDEGEEAASWRYVDLMNHWNKKHAQAAFIPSMCALEPSRKYCYGNIVKLGEGVDFLLFLKAMFNGRIFYDPGIKVENASAARPTTKRRSQFRVKSGNLAELYLKMSTVDVLKV